LPRREPQPRSPSCRTSFDEYITGAKDGRVTDGSLPDGRPEAKAVDTANRAVKEKLARDQADDSPVERTVKSHPIGVAAGAVGGMAAGAVAGIAAGPVGSLFGALAGAVLGGAMGSGGSPAAGAPIDSPAWREHHATLAGAAPHDQYENATGSATRHSAPMAGNAAGKTWNRRWRRTGRDCAGRAGCRGKKRAAPHARPGMPAPAARC
jgi:hypothetical protein